MKRLFFLSLITVLLINFLFASTTGKVAGRITDAKSGVPLIGVNVVIETTAMGAATDNDGYYVIVNIPPGVYDITATMMGYKPYTVRSTRVEIDMTSTFDFRMEVEAIQGEVIKVTAQRKLIKKDVAASQISITAESIESMPVISIKDVLGLQAGVTTDLGIRGSGSDQAIFMVDGVILRDERTNQPNTSIPLSAVNEISVQSAGFGAEYHNVRSGVVNVVTKEGDTKNYTGTFSMSYSPPAEKQFGTSVFDANSFWLRSFLDPDVCWTGTSNGAWNEYMQRQYPAFDGWNSLAAATMKDDNPANDLSPAAAQRLFIWEHRKKGYIQKADQNLDFGFGGPVPLVSEMAGDLRFYLSHRSSQNMYPIQLSRDGVYDESWMLKLTSDLSPRMKLSIFGIYGELQATTFSRMGRTRYMNDGYDIAEELDRRGHTVTARIFATDYWCPIARYTNTLSAKFTHMLSPSTFYEVLLKKTGKKYHVSPGAHRDSTAANEIWPGYFADEAPFGFEEGPVSGIEGMLMGGAMSTSRDYSNFASYSLNFDFTSQIHRRHQIKTGFELALDDFNMDFGMVNYTHQDENFWTKTQLTPYKATVYAQDKLEFEGFISTVGLIMEYIDNKAEWYSADPYSSDFYSSDYDAEIDEEFKTEAIEPKLVLSPRIGISHPITANSKLYFNYGHYRQMPIAEDLYLLQRTPSNQMQYIGDPNLPLAKTVSYELGYDHALFNSYLLHLSAYYKDISNQEDWTRYISTDSKVIYYMLTSNNYEDIRGLEIELSKAYGRWLSGFVNYEYRVGTSGYFGIKYYYENPSDQRSYLSHNQYQEKPVPMPEMKSKLDFHTPSDFGFSVGNYKPLANFHFAFLVNWVSGYWMTWNPNNLNGVLYNVKWKDFQNVNLKISKVFSFGKTRVKIFADIYNLLNTKYLSGEGFYDAYDYNYYMYSLHLPNDVANQLGKSGNPYPNIPGHDRPGDYRKAGVAFQPVEWAANIANLATPNADAIYYDAGTKRYMEYRDTGWQEVDSGRMDKILENRAYIDMPNQSFLNFLNPRDIFLGINVSFDLK